METRCGHKSEITVLLVLRQKDPRFEASLRRSTNLRKQQLQQEMQWKCREVYMDTMDFFFSFSFFLFSCEE